MESRTVRNLLDDCLFRIYDSPASITVVLGKWKTGKTDFSLRLAYDELHNRLGLVKYVASNIKTDKLHYIDNFDDLELWMFQNKERKAFIYDEAVKSTPSRRAMSQINTKWLEYVPELSKARCHLIVVTQEEDFTERLFLHPTFVRAKWIKLDKKVVDLIITRDSEIYRFHDIPPTSVQFDPYAIAVWKLESEKPSFDIIDNDIKIALDYAKLESHEVMAKYGLRFRSDLTSAVKRGITKLYDVVVRVERKQQIEKATTTL
ncbi:MAG: hypothetical protein QW175_07640 [Candidatus Bathyarchaeia archaeon]